MANSKPNTFLFIGLVFFVLVAISSDTKVSASDDSSLANPIYEGVQEGNLEDTNSDTAISSLTSRGSRYCKTLLPGLCRSGSGSGSGSHPGSHARSGSGSGSGSGSSSGSGIVHP